MAPTHDRRLELARLANDQHGIVTFHQLRALGFSASWISRLQASGFIHRVQPATYAVGHNALSSHARWTAAIMTVGHDAHLSHTTAAAVWGIWPEDSTIHITATTRHRHLPGIRVHHRAALHAMDVTQRGGHLVTSLARTLLDLCALHPEHRVLKALHEADYLGHFELEHTLRVLDGNRGARGARRLRDVLLLRKEGSKGSRSGPELDFVRRYRACGGRGGELNIPLETQAGPFECDFVIRELRICLEIDGPGHARPATRRDDANRDYWLTLAGWTVLRCGIEEIPAMARELAARSRLLRAVDSATGGTNATAASPTPRTQHQLP